MRRYARLESIGRHLSAPPVAPVVQPAAAGTPEDGLKLLTDSQMQQFIGQGFVMLQAEELSPDFHREVYENARAEYGPDAEETGGAHGTTVERVPGLTTLIESPTVAGALQSLLGPEYAHGHLGPSGCAFHASGGPGGPGQPFHKDTQRGHICGHRTRAVMVMYYPDGAEADSGPTAIVPSSHILARDGLGLSYGIMDEGPEGEKDRDDWGGLGGRAEILPNIAPGLFEHKVVVPASKAGTVCIVHEDMVHRGTPKDMEELFRPMFKWSFTRLHEPSAPSWQHDPSASEPEASDWPALVAPQAGPICESLWRWHKGEDDEAEAAEVPAPASAVDDDETATLAAVVLAPPCDGDEAARIGAAYALGACGSEKAIATLATALTADEHNESARRAGSLGLGAAGDCAVPTLLRVLEETAGSGGQHQQLSGLVAGSAVEALGEAAMTANLAVVSALDATCRRQYEMITAAEASPLSSPEELPEFTEENVHVNGDLRVAVMLPVACRPVRHRPPSSPLHRQAETERHMACSSWALTFKRTWTTACSVRAHTADRMCACATALVLQIAARYLAIALAQIALGRIVQRWASDAETTVLSAAASAAAAAAEIRSAVLNALRPWSGMPAPRIRKDNGRALFQLCAALGTAAATPPSEHAYLPACLPACLHC